MLQIERSEKQNPPYEQIERYFVEQIQDGFLEADAALPGAVELGRQLKVSHLTVRRAYDRLAERGLIYRIRGKGTFVRRMTSVTSIALLMPSCLLSRIGTSPVYAAIANQLAKHMSGSGWQLESQMIHASREQLRAKQWGACDIESFKRMSVRGLYVLGAFLPDWAHQWLANQQIPSVAINMHAPVCDASVSLDEANLLRIAGEYVAQRGCQRLGVVWLDTEPEKSEKTRKWIIELLRKAGVRSEAIHVVGVPRASQFDARVATRHLLHGQSQVDAIISLDDVLMHGVCAGCIQEGTHVPGDIVLLSLVNKGVTDPFLLPVVRLDYDIDHVVEIASGQMDGLIKGIDLEFSHQHVQPILTLDDPQGLSELYKVTS